MRATPILVAALVIAGCDNPVSVSDPGVVVVSESDAFRIRNRSEALPLVFVIVEREIAAVIDLASCETWENRLPPAGERLVPYSEVMGYGPDAEFAFVYWCQLDGETVVGSGSLQAPFGD